MAGKTILIVDDEDELVNLLKLRLEHEGYRVLHVRSGKDVIPLVQTEDPSLILLDIMIPDENGYDVCYALKHHKDTCSIPVILFTAKPAWGKEMKELGDFVRAEDYVGKPFDSDVLLAKIRAYIHA
jgi:DNA-binding response OmpR family regulator